MARRKSLRSQLYGAARDLGNVEAVEHGGASGGAKRYARRAVYRKTNTVTGSFLRALGLSGGSDDATLCQVFAHDECPPRDRSPA